MRKTFYSLCMTCILLITGIVMSGCNKNDQNNPQEPAKVQTYKMSIQASKGNNGNQTDGPKKVLVLDGTTLNATWAAGERVTVYNETKSATLDGYLEAQSNGASTQLLGELTGTIEAGDRLTLKYLAPNYNDQRGTLAYISVNCDYAVAETVEVESILGGTIYTSDEAAFVNQQAVVKFTLKDAVDHTTLLSPTALTFNDGTSDIATLTSIPAATYTTNGDGVLFVAVPGFSDKTVTLTATVGSDTYTFEKASTTLANGRYYALTVEMNKPASAFSNGILPGEFSVSETTKVHFSQGNLQYVGTWQFAEHQWDNFGTSQYDDHRDLFCWGTGDAPNKVSEDNNDYSTFVDWGVNAITNGGNTANQWRTLTKDEWMYLFFTRANATTLFGLGSVNGVNGLILLPDNWSLPTGVSFTASTTQELSNEGTYYYDNRYPYQDHFMDNTYTAEQWSVMEASGAVFLPEAGDRSGAVLGSAVNGFYWSTTPNGTNRAERLYFNGLCIFPHGQDYRYIGESVRLVR